MEESSTREISLLTRRRDSYLRQERMKEDGGER